MYRSNKISTSINDTGKEVIKLMKCPKCGNDMLTGEIGISSSSRGMPSIFWAPREVFNRLIPQALTIKKAVSEGGVHIKIGNGLTSNRTAGYICKECNCVLLDNVCDK